MKLQILPVLVSLLAIGIFLGLQNSISIYAQIGTGEEEKNVELNHKIRSGVYSDKLIGQVQNMIDKDVQLVQIIATYYDANGEMIGSGTTFALPPALKPNMKAPFELLLDPDIANEIKEYMI